MLRLVVVLLVGIVGAGAAIGAEFRLYYGPATTSRPAIDAREARPRTAGPALFEPKSGCYLGAYIELDPSLKNVFVDQNASRRKLPSEFELVVGKSHAMYFFYLGYGRPLPMDWVRYLAKHGKYVHIALEPNDGLRFVKDDAYLRKLADDMARSGARIFLRFASEMNGPWVNYHGDPQLYKEKWRLVTRVIRERCTNVAMVWCPYATPLRPIPDYYPGDEWVDWVGVNMYNVTYFNQDRDTPAHHVEPTDLLDPVYRAYADRKPIMIAEYATTHFSALENKPVIGFAEDNIRRLFKALQSRYPRVKAINYFNSNNLLLAHRQNNNYTVTGDPRVLVAYRQAIAPEYFLDAPTSPVAAGPLAAEKTTEAFAAQLGMRPLEDGQSFEGKVVVTAWLADYRGKPIVRFLLDGRVIPSAQRQDFWETTLDLAALGGQERRLTVEALDPKGRQVSIRTVHVRG
ncbi:MAG TPA: glycosyl hydrolase [Fimbriimonadaceae bacterium]|nr:glycosyl hydrolase [Fimbriimonadaceae bacterium]